jgi:hypothetical protein
MNKNTENVCLLRHDSSNFLVKMTLKAQKTGGFHGRGRSDYGTIYYNALLLCKQLQLFGQFDNNKPPSNADD